MTEDLAKISKTIHQETRKSRKQFYVFLFCLVLSSILWLFVKMSKDVTVTMSFPVEFINVPVDKTLTGTPAREVRLEFKEKAAALFILEYVAPKPVILIDLTNVKLDKTGESYVTTISMSSIQYFLNQNDFLPFKIISVTPETLVLSFTDDADRELLEDTEQLHDGIK